MTFMKIRHRNRQERWPGTLPEKAMMAVCILGPVLGTLLILSGFLLLFLMPEGAVWILLAGLVCLAYGIMALQTAMAEFSFSNEGVWVKYPLEKQHCYLWEDFQQICVCYCSRATEMNGYPIVCLVRKGEKTDHFGRWKTGSVFHYRNLLCLDYSEEQLQEIRGCCPYEIPDLRGKENYRL